MNNREWEKFYGGPLDNYDERVYVTINRKGQIYLNRHTYHLIGAPKNVVLYFSRRLDSIMVVTSNVQTAENFPVKRKQTGWVIHASPFCRHYGIHPTGTHRFVRPDIEDNRIKLDLTTTVEVKGNKNPHYFTSAPAAKR